MTEATKKTGTCLCGAVRITAKNPSNKVGTSIVECVENGVAGHLWKSTVVQIYLLKEKMLLQCITHRVGRNVAFVKIVAAICFIA